MPVNILAQAGGPATQPEPALVEWVDRASWLPSWLNREVFGLNVTVARLILAFVLLLAALVLGKIVRTVIDAYAKRLAKADRRTLLRLFLHSLAGPTYVVVFGYGLGLALALLLRQIESLRGYAGQIGQAVVYMGLGWFIYNLVDIAEYYLNRLVTRTDTKLDDQLVPLLRRAMRVLIVILVALFIAQNVFKANVGAMLAGLGIGGLAIALASQDTVSNLFGSITIFADRPFAIGDLVKIEGYYGTVEEVGFRSTRVRTFDGHLVAIPNAKVANTPVENVGRRPSIRRVANITITYDTPPDKVERAVEIIKQILGDTEHVLPDYWVAFNEFNDWSLNLSVKYNVAPPDWLLSLRVHQEVNLRIMRAFEAEPIEFAFPTQTLYHKTDAPLQIDQANGGGRGDRGGPAGQSPG